MSDLATSESLQRLELRQTEILSALDDLCRQIEQTLQQVAPRHSEAAESPEPSLSTAA